MSLFLRGENRNAACTSPLVHHSAAMPTCCSTRSKAEPSLVHHAHPTQHEATAQAKASRPTPTIQSAPATRDSNTAQLDPGTPSSTKLWKVVHEQNRRALRVARSTLCSGSQRERPPAAQHAFLRVGGRSSVRPSTFTDFAKIVSSFTNFAPSPFTALLSYVSITYLLTYTISVKPYR